MIQHLGIMRLLDLINAVNEHTNKSLPYALVATLYDRRNSISRQVLEQLNENFDGSMLKSINNIDTRLRESALVGEPITVFAPKTRASKNYRQLASELNKVITKYGVELCVEKRN